MSRSIVAKPTKCILQRLPCSLLIAILLSLGVSAQQPTRQKSPRLTTDDVTPAEKSAEPTPEAAKPEEAGKPAPSKQSELKGSPEESSWRESVSKARDKANELERAAEQAELRITGLRNELGVSGQSTRYRNETAAELESAGQRLTELRSQARAASDDLNKLLEYGKEKGYREAEGPKPTSDEGKPNEEYYRSKIAKLNESIESEQRRIQLYQNRLNEISQRILMNGGKNGGDNFYMLQLQKDRDEAQQKLDESRAALAAAQAELEALKEEARRAGVTPEVFR